MNHPWDHQLVRQVKAELSHSWTAVTNSREGVSGHSVIDHASDRFNTKSGYSQMDGSKP